MRCHCFRGYVCHAHAQSALVSSLEVEAWACRGFNTPTPSLEGTTSWKVLAWAWHPSTCGRRRGGVRLQSMLVVAVLLLFSTSVHACNIPVFRYALENWPPLPYELVIHLRGPVDAKQQADVRALQQYLDQAPLNATLQIVDESRLRKSFGVSPAEASLVLRFPKESPRAGVVVHEGPLDADAVKALIDSPARQAIAKRLLKGESAVWVLLDCGDKAKDDAAHDRLHRILGDLEKKLKLPERTESPKDKLLSDKIELKIAFSVVRIAADDARERFLRHLLLRVEDGLLELKEPMAFPVFGQGKALYAFVGKGINEETVAQAGRFLLSACKCEVQEENPGVSLLMNVAWVDGLSGRLTAPPELPPLTGLLKAKEVDADNTAEENDSASQKLGFNCALRPPWWRHFIILIPVSWVVILILFYVTWRALRKS